MADNVISNLSIEVTASADKAASVFDRLASSAGRLRGAASGAAGGLQDMAHGAQDAGNATQEAGTQAGSASPKIRSVGKEAKNAGDNAKKGASGLATFWQSLKRIAFYRFIRSVIRSITDAFKTGITNLYQWSAAVNGTFAKSMDRIATSTLYLKNSLGAMLAPIIERLTPIIEWIIDRIVDVINWINKLFAALSGSQTYTVAKKVATKWQDAGKSAASSARKAADDIKRTILGFDEINKLEKQNTSSGSGGSGSSKLGTDYTNMFEERKLDGWMSKLASFIDKFNLGVPAVLGGILAGVEAIRLAFKALASLSLGWLKDMVGKTIDIAVSLVRKGWSTIKKWALSFGEAVVDLAVKIKTTALELWAKFAAAWSALSPVLKVGIAISVTAAVLWAAYKLAWALVPDKVLAVKARIETTAAQLKNSLFVAWSALTVWYLNVKLRLETMAVNLKDSIVKAWGNLQTWYLGVRLKLLTTAAQLKNDITRAWSKLTVWALSVKLRLETTAAKLKGDIVKAWAALGAWTLGIKLAIITKASELWEGVKKGWNALGEKVVTFKTQISTTMSSLWDWVKNNWEKVAITALGIGIAIATPWSAIAASLGALWADVMASFGGSLAFAVTPTIAYPKIGEKSKMQEISDYARLAKFVVAVQESINSLKPKMEIIANAKAGLGMMFKNTSYQTGSLAPIVSDTTSSNTVSARVGMGMRNRAYGGGMEPIVEDTKTTNTVDLLKGWWGSVISALDLDYLSTEVAVSLYQTWGWWGALNYMGLDNLSTYIEVYLHKTWWGTAESWLGLDNLTATVTSVVSTVSNVASTVASYFSAVGGIFQGGRRYSIPQYAGGTSNVNHGTLFWAGERGAEIVGNAGGRTEVLNRSQIASAIYSAVSSAMAPAAANFASAAESMGVAETGFDLETLAEMVRQGVEQAMSRSNDLDRQRNEYLRQINDKDFTAEVTSNDINNAQRRMNRRAGTTVVAVG